MNITNRAGIRTQINNTSSIILCTTRTSKLTSPILSKQSVIYILTRCYNALNFGYLTVTGVSTYVAVSLDSTWRSLELIGRNVELTKASGQRMVIVAWTILSLLMTFLFSLKKRWFLFFYFFFFRITLEEGSSINRPKFVQITASGRDWAVSAVWTISSM